MRMITKFLLLPVALILLLLVPGYTQQPVSPASETEQDTVQKIDVDHADLFEYLENDGEIVQKLNQSSRFLKYDNKEKVWKTISALAARDKVSHALRVSVLSAIPTMSYDACYLLTKILVRKPQGASKDGENKEHTTSSILLLGVWSKCQTNNPRRH